MFNYPLEASQGLLVLPQQSKLSMYQNAQSQSRVRVNGSFSNDFPDYWFTNAAYL